MKLSTAASGFDKTDLLTDDNIENILQIPSLDFIFDNKSSLLVAVFDFQIPTPPQVDAAETANFLINVEFLLSNYQICSLKAHLGISTSNGFPNSSNN